MLRKIKNNFVFILDFLKNNILGQLGDQIGSIWLGDIFYSKKFHLLNYYSIEYFRLEKSSVLNNLFSNIYNFIYLSISYLLGGVLAYNLLTILILITNSICFYSLLKSLNVRKIIAILFSSFLSFIPYFYMHFEHQTLLIIFPSLIVIKYLLKLDLSNLNFKDIFLVSIWAILQGLFSLYLIYFLFLYIFVYFSFISISKKNLKVIYNFVFTIFLTGVLFLIFNFGLILDFLQPSRTQTNYNFPDKTISQTVSNFSFDREKPLNDFLYFSSRPWYFILFPSTHPLFGNFTKETINYFSETKNYWIFKNYFPYEHNASFIGFTVLVLTIISQINQKTKNNKIIKNLLFLNIFLFIFSMPPYFALSGKNIYTPSYLLYLIFPMFRTLSRIVIFIQINFFLISAITLDEITKFLSIKKFAFILIIIFWGMSLDYIMNYKFTNISVLNETSNFLKNNNSENTMISVYPNSFRNDFLLNMTSYEGPYFNPSGLVRSDINFDSGKFTSNLDSCDSLIYFEAFNGKFIVIRDYNNSEFKYLNKLPTVFESNKERVIIKTMDNLKDICSKN